MVHSPPKRRWIPFFLALIVLSLTAVITLIVYNLRQQLKLEQLVAARQLWADKGLPSYQLVYTLKKGTDPKAETYVVRVRSGQVVSVSLDGRPLAKRLLSHYGMEAMFDHIREFLDQDAKPGQPRTFARAIFDPANGALRWYVRRVMGGGQRLEITVDALLPLEDGARQEVPGTSRIMAISKRALSLPGCVALFR